MYDKMYYKWFQLYIIVQSVYGTVHDITYKTVKIACDMNLFQNRKGAPITSNLAERQNVIYQIIFSYNKNKSDACFSMFYTKSISRIKVKKLKPHFQVIDQ